MDGTYYIRRNFHALDKCRVSGEFATDTEESKGLVQDGNLVIVSFLQTTLKFIRELDYSRKVIVCWDRGTYRYRPKEKYTEYKSDRVYDDSYQVLWDAQNVVIELLRDLGIHSIQVSGCEADDLGMYFSHNSDDCWLSTIDSDWLQSIRPTTQIHYAGKKMITYDEVVKGHISTPFDLAISKAITGGHDNLRSIPTKLDLESGILGYKSRTLDQEVLDAIDYNMNLSRLDKILNDSEVHEIIKGQLLLTKSPSKIDILNSLSKINKYPPYFLGVLSKYVSIHSN